MNNNGQLEKPDHVILLEELNDLLKSIPVFDNTSLEMRLEGLKIKREIVALFNDRLKLNSSVAQHNEQLAFQKRVIDYQHKLEVWRTKKGWANDRAISRNNDNAKMMAETVGFAKITLNSLLLVNGGAVLAILAFLGNVLKTPECKIDSINFLGWFIAATFAAIFASGLSYITQSLYSEGWRKAGFYNLAHKFRLGSLVIAMLSLSCFLMGSISSYNAFSKNKIFTCDYQVKIEPQIKPENNVKRKP